MSSLLAGESSQSTQQAGAGQEGANNGEAQKVESGAQDWKAQYIPEDIRNEKTWEKYQDPSAAFKSLFHLEKKMGSAVNIPDDKATPEDRAAFYEKLGVPKTHEGYKWQEPKLPEGASWDKAQLGEFVQAAHKLNLTPAQLQGVLDYYGDKIGSQLVNPETVYAETKETLTKEWGANAEKNFAAAREAAKLLGPEALEKFKAAGLDNDPVILKAMSKLGLEMGEGQSVHGDPQQEVDAAQALAQISKTMATKDHPLHDKAHPGHKAAVAEHEQLLKIAYAPKEA